MKGYLDAKELESYKKEDLQELAKQLGVDAEGTKKEIATRCAAVEVDIPDESELTEEDKRAAAEAAAEAAASEPTEVSRQAYDDCDGSGHGYYEITYSDGSVRYEEY
mgnify:CR=1 FL=1